MGQRETGAALAPLLVDTAGLARLLGVSESWVEKRAAEAAWEYGDLPKPIWLAHRPERQTRYQHGEKPARPHGVRRWRLETVVAWVELKERAS